MLEALKYLLIADPKLGLINLEKRIIVGDSFENII